VLYIANLTKTMAVILNDAKNMASWSCPCCMDGGTTPALQNVGFYMPKGRHKEFKDQILALQEKMEA
jgi:hypothetical protein